MPRGEEERADLERVEALRSSESANDDLVEQGPRLPRQISPTGRRKINPPRKSVIPRQGPAIPRQGPTIFGEKRWSRGRDQ